MTLDSAVRVNDDVDITILSPLAGGCATGLGNGAAGKS
jgi:hypothetical protein